MLKTTIYYGSKIARMMVTMLAISYSQAFAYAQAQADDEASATSSQGFTLFEEVESTQARTNSPSRSNRESRATTAEPEFTLLGTSRIGSRYSAIVQHRSGDTVLVKADASGNTPIEDHEGYTIVNMSAGKIFIRYPGSNPCIEFSERGVRCNEAANIAELVLANGEPLASSSPASNVSDQSAREPVVENTNADPANPFEALRNGQAVRNGVVTQDGNRGNGRFTPRRINPEDVPEGMRIVATPFGDRLVEQ